MRAIRAMAFVAGTLGLVAGCGGGSTPTGSDGGAGQGGQTGQAGSGGGAGSGAGGAKGTTAVTNCDITDSTGYHQCIEYAIGYTASADKGCGILKGTYSTGPCDAASSLGGCKQPNGSSSMTTYYYPSATITPAAVMAQCVDDGNATYVAP